MSTPSSANTGAGRQHPVADRKPAVRGCPAQARADDPLSRVHRQGNPDRPGRVGLPDARPQEPEPAFQPGRSRVLIREAKAAVTALASESAATTSMVSISVDIAISPPKAQRLNLPAREVYR